MRIFGSLRKKTIVMLMLLAIALSLFGCSNEEAGYNAIVYELDEEAEALVTNPSVEYIVAALSQTDTVIGVEVDPSPKDEYATIYFSSSMVDQAEFSSDESVADKGTAAGGSIDVFETKEAALERDEYLHGFDDNVIFNSGGHAVAGTIVIRTSNKLDADKQAELTNSVLGVLTSGEITDEMVEQVTSVPTDPMDDGLIEMPFSHKEVYYKHYTEVETMLTELGFINIEYTAVAMNPDVEDEFDGSVLSVRIDGELEFEKGDVFASETSVVISYSEDRRIPVPESSLECEELHYTEVVKLFEEAGFTNVQAEGTEVEYTGFVDDGSVVVISVDGNAFFEANEMFNPDVPVIVRYRIILPQETEPETTPQTEAPTQPTEDTPEEIEKEPEDNKTMVWIPTNGGKKYHTRAGCSNMKDPKQVTEDEAKSMGFTPCKRCH